jgi:hypothetical protein
MIHSTSTHMYHQSNPHRRHPHRLHNHHHRCRLRHHPDRQVLPSSRSGACLRKCASAARPGPHDSRQFSQNQQNFAFCKQLPIMRTTCRLELQEMFWKCVILACQAIRVELPPQQLWLLLWPGLCGDSMCCLCFLRCSSVHNNSMLL